MRIISDCNARRHVRSWARSACMLTGAAALNADDRERVKNAPAALRRLMPLADIAVTGWR